MTLPVAVSQGLDDPVGSLAQRVLDTILATYEAARKAIEPIDKELAKDLKIPKRQIIAVSEVPVDDDNGQIAVMFGGTHIGPPGAELTTPMKWDHAPRTAIFDIQLWRAISTGRGGASTARAPKAEVVTRQAKVAMQDSWLLLEAAFKMDDASGAGVIASTAPLPPQGGLQGIALSVSLQVV